ncbi:hypothetical protein EAF04_002108 [Stromatinia cepivora]|nr:hypothetical protein EAF04_002108 [Stromatinia cepivora]
MAALCARFNLMTRDQSINSFVNPPPQESTFTQDYSDDLVLEDSSTINLIWTSNYTNIVLTISQVLNCVGGELGCDSNSTLLESIPKSPNVAPWTVDASPYNLTESNIFYFTIYNGSTRNNIASFTSRYFNISTSNDILHFTDTAPSLPTKRNEVADPVSTIDLPIGAKIGIGLGIGIVSCVMVLAIALLFRYIRRSRCRSHAAKNPPINMVNVEDNPRARRESWVQALGMHQGTPDEERAYDSSQHRWASPGDVAPRYESRDVRRERCIPDAICLEDLQEPIHSQNNHHSNPTSHNHLTPREEAASYFNDDSCGS